MGYVVKPAKGLFPGLYAIPGRDLTAKVYLREKGIELNDK